MSILSVDFYRVDLAQEGIQFHQIIRLVSQIAMNDTERVREVRQVPLRMQEAFFSRETVEFDLLKVRINDPAEKANLRGETEAIPFEQDEGLGDKTACFYHIPSRVLLVQNNYYGPTASGVAAYFEEHQDGSDIQLMPLITEEGWEAITDWNKYRCVEIQTAGLGDAPLSRRQHEMSVESVIRLNERFGAKKSAIRFWMGSDRKGSLRNVVDEVKAFLRLRNVQHVDVDKIIVSGKDAGDQKQVIDLISHRIRVVFQLGNRTARHLSYQERRGLLHDAWQERREEAIAAAS